MATDRKFLKYSPVKLEPSSFFINFAARSSNWCIDYKKAFDSVPHAWIIKSLQIHKVSPVLINFLSTSMHKWNTKLLLNHSKGQITSNDININSG